MFAGTVNSRSRRAGTTFCLGLVARHAEALLVQHPERHLRTGQSLFGRAAEPAGRLGFVLVRAFALQVHEAEPVLRQRMPLVGGGAHPAVGLSRVFHVPEAILKHHRHPVLGVGVALFGERREQGHGRGEMLGLERGDAARKLHVSI